VCTWSKNYWADREKVWFFSKGYLVNCLEHFFLLFFWFVNNVSSIVCIVSNFIFTPLAVEMLFFSLLCPQGVNSTKFAWDQEIPDQ
jgi:hypothetical protein